MPIVQVQVWQGFGEDRARRLIEGITSSFEDVGVPAGAVQVVIQEVPRSYWGIGGQVSADRGRPGGESDQRSERSGEYGPRRDDRPARQDRGDRSSGFRSSPDGPSGDRGSRPARTWRGIARIRVPALRAATVRRVRTGVRDPIRARGGGRAGVAQAANPPQSARSLSCKKRVTLAVNRSG